MRLFKADAVPESLAEDGIGDRHLRALGGKSDHRKGTPPWFNHCWRVLAFRNYSEYAETDEFHAGLFALCEFAHGHQDVIMCAEAVWWRCHRRFIIDYLLVGCTHVDHIMRLVGGFGDSVIFTTVTDDARTCRRDPKSARHPAGRLHRKLALRSGLLREPHVEGCNTLRLREPEAAMAGVTVEVSC